MLPAKKKIGVIGGGQLGKMLIEASRPWNTEYVVLEDDLNCPASSVASKVIKGSLQDADKIRQLAKETDVLTFEIEHINVSALEKLEEEGVIVIPSPRVLRIIQDKGIQKEFYREHGIPTAAFRVVESDRIGAHLNEFTGDKIVIKSCTGGYDGKGVSIENRSDLESGNSPFRGRVVMEQFESNMKEVSVIVARDSMGDIRTYEPIEMHFNPVSNLVEFLYSPATLDTEISSKCQKVALNAVEALGGTGIFAVELFITGKGEVLVNEIAPRPHNSGHHTIEGSYTSQFEQLNRILLNLPLGDSRMICPAAMINLVGPEGLSGEYGLEFTDQLLQMTGVYIHLYNKAEIRPHRKMGHITVLGNSTQELMEKAEVVKNLNGFTEIVKS